MPEPAALALIDGQPAALPLDDRGLAYGDGLFETVLLFRGRPVWWDAHLERLARGAAALGIAAPDRRVWQDDLAALLAGPAPLAERQVLKLILTRGSSGRGYAPDRSAAARRIVQLLPAPADRPDWRRDGIVLRWCALRLAEQPRLAGLKHLNRLEQVLARAEWDDPAIAEGLLCRQDGQPVSATAANLFVVAGRRLLTPPVDRCGVAGVCRRFLLAQPEASECELDRQAVLQADELFLCNSLRGILPVARLGERVFSRGPFTRALMARLAAAEPAFAFECAG
jgi:4-amino-4-deoxychorismate lyase